MIEPSLAVQLAITAALNANGGVGAPVRDEVPENAPLPYVQTGDDQVIPNPAEGFDLSATVRSVLHVYVSRTGGRRQAKSIAGQIVAVLDNAALDLSASGWTLNTIHHAGTQLLDDPDGSRHAVVTFLSLVDLL